MLGKLFVIPLYNESDGRVYKINIGDKFYIGSTKMGLKIRANKHNTKLKSGSKCKIYEEARLQKVDKLYCEEIYYGKFYKDIENEMITKHLGKENCLNMRVVKTTPERRKMMLNKKKQCDLCGKLILSKNMARHKKNIHKVVPF